MPEETSLGLITEEMKAALNKDGPRHVIEVERGTVRQWARAAGYTNPIYYDVEAARAAGHPDLPCPPGFLGRHIYRHGVSHLTFSIPTDAGFPQNPKLMRGLNGGMSTKLFRRIYAGETLYETTKTVKAEERAGSLGPMLITMSETTYRDEKGEVVAITTGTGIAY